MPVTARTRKGEAMSPIEFAPKGLFNMRHYVLSRDGVEIGRIDFGGIRQPTAIVIGGATFHPAREGALRKATFHLDGNGARLASAAPAGVSFRRFRVQAGARTYELAVTSWLGRTLRSWKTARR
jgi:hypothetical protein